MPRIPPNVPAPDDLLCEFCGYTLNGLPPDVNCPECGHPAALSVSPDRQPPAWESRGGFWATTAAVILRPTRFFHHFTTRGDPAPAAEFAKRHIGLASALFAVAAVMHLEWLLEFNSAETPGWIICGLLLLAFWAVVDLSLTYLTRAAAKLTNWEATYRGLRLSTPVVRRGLHYHAAHYLPVAVLTLITVGGFRVVYLNHWLYTYNGLIYLSVLSGEVIVAAVYLFSTYWIAMRNMMYANR